MPGIGIHQVPSKSNLKSNIKKADTSYGDLPEAQVVKKKKGTRRKVQFRLDSEMTDLTKDAVMRPEQAHFKYEDEEYYDEESENEEQLVISDYDQLKIRKENFSQQFIHQSATIQTDEQILSVRDSQTQNVSFIIAKDLNQTPQPLSMPIKDFSENVSRHSSGSDQTERLDTIINMQNNIASEQLQSHDSSALDQLQISNDTILSKEYTTLINNQHVGKKIKTQKVSLDNTQYIQKEIRVDESNINLSSFQELNPSNLQFGTKEDNNVDQIPLNHNESYPQSLTNLAVQKIAIHEETQSVDAITDEVDQPQLQFDHSQLKEISNLDYNLDQTISRTNIRGISGEIMDSSPGESMNQSPLLFGATDGHGTIDDSKEDNDSPGKAVIRRSSAFKGMQQAFGEGTNGLNKLNELLDQKKAQQNQFKRLYTYVETLENYKKEMGLENISKLMINHPNPEILDIFCQLFKSFQDMPEQCKKRAFMELQTKNFGLCERVLMIPSGTPKSMSQLTPDEETNMYMICNGEVVILKNEKGYKKFMQTEDKIAAERQEASQINDTVQFGSVAKIGWVITQYMLKTPKFIEIIDKKRDHYRKKGLMKSMDKSIFLGKGDVFGDFSLIKHRVFNPVYAIAMHPETQVLYLNKQKLREILDVDPENFRIIRDKIPAISSNSTVIQKKICRSFEECEFYPGQVIIKEGDSPKFMYLIKEGTCGIYNEIQIQKLQRKVEIEIEVKPPFPTEEFEQLKKLQVTHGSLSPRSPALSNNSSPPKEDPVVVPKKEPKKKKSKKKLEEKQPQEELFSTQTVKVCEISKYEWIGDEFILTEKLAANRNFNIEAGKHTQTVIARTYIKALKVSCLDIRRKIPKEYQKELKTLTTSKIEFLAERIENVRKGILQFKKLDEESKPYEQKTEGIKQIHPHIPSKMVSSIGFGDGKIRNRHHFRCKDSIRIGEIALNEELILMDESVPLSERIIKFEPKNVQKGKQFQVLIDRQDKKTNHQESEMQTSEEVSFVQKKIENLQHQKWLQQQNQDKKKRSPKKQQQNDYDSTQFDVKNSTNMRGTTSRNGAGSKSQSPSPCLDIKTSRLSQNKVQDMVSQTARVHQSPEAKKLHRLDKSLQNKKGRNQTVHGSMADSLEFSKGSYEDHSNKKGMNKDFLYPVAKMRDKKKQSQNSRKTSFNVSQVQESTDAFNKLNISQDSYNEIDMILQMGRGKNNYQSSLSKQQILDKISAAQIRSKQKGFDSTQNDYSENLDLQNQNLYNLEHHHQENTGHKIVKKKFSAAIPTNEENTIIQRTLKDASALTGATASVNQSGRDFIEDVELQMKILEKPQSPSQMMPGINIIQSSTNQSRYQSSVTANFVDSDQAYPYAQYAIQSQQLLPAQDQMAKKMYIQDQNVEEYPIITEEMLQSAHGDYEEQTADVYSSLAYDNVVIEEGPSGISTLNDYNPDLQEYNNNLEELRRLRRKQNEIVQRKPQFQLGLALDSIQPNHEVSLIQTQREVAYNGMESNFLDSYSDVNFNARNSMALPKTQNVEQTQDTSQEYSALDPMIQKFQAINMFKSNKELDGIQTFLDRDHNRSDMFLAKKNRQRYQQYLKNFKGKCIPSSHLFQQSLVKLEQSDPEQYHRIMKLKSFKEMTSLQHMDKQQIQVRKFDKMAQVKKGFHEDFQPQHNNKILTSRFGKLVQQSQEFAIDGIDDINQIRGLVVPEKRRAVSLSRAFDVGKGRNLSVGRSGSLFPSRKLNIVDKTPFQKQIEQHTSENYGANDSTNFQQVEDRRRSEARPAKYEIQADLSGIKKQGSSQVYNNRYGSFRDSNFGFGQKDKDVVSLRGSMSPEPWRDAKLNNAKQSPINSDYQKSFATSLNAHAIMTMIMSGYKVPGLSPTALGDPAFLEQLEQPEGHHRPKRNDSNANTGPDTALNIKNSSGGTGQHTQGPTPQNQMTHKFARDTSYENKSEKSLLRFHFRETMRAEQINSKKHFDILPKSGANKQRGRNKMQVSRIETILPEIYPQVQKEQSSVLSSLGAPFSNMDQSREYGKFTDKLKLVRQRKEELFTQKTKRKLKVDTS